MICAPLEQENNPGGFPKLAEAFAELVEAVNVTSLTDRKHEMKCGQVGKDSGMKLPIEGGESGGNSDNAH